MKLFSKMLLPLIIVFAAVCIIIMAASVLLTKYHIDRNVLLGANLFFMLLGIPVFFIQAKALNNPNPNVFIRSITLGMLIKMFATVLAVLAYTGYAGAAFDKKAVFISLFIYLVYLAAEVMAISKLNKKNHV